MTIFVFRVLKVISYNKYTGPYANFGNPEFRAMKFWNQNNETCRFQYAGYGKLSRKKLLAKSSTKFNFKDKNIAPCRNTACWHVTF